MLFILQPKVSFNNIVFALFILFYQKNNKLEHFQSQQILQNIVLIDFMNKLMKYLKHLTKEKMIHGKIKKILKKLLSNI